MSLLQEELPVFSLAPRLDPSEFFDRCEIVANKQGYKIDRRRPYAGKNTDQLNIYVGNYSAASPMIRMVSFPELKGRLNLDVVDDRVTLEYEQYTPNALKICRGFLHDYKSKYGIQLRLGVPRRPPHFDPATSNISSIPYARQKFNQAIRSMVTGKEDVRERLRDACLIFHMISPDELPEPLQSELRWVYRQMTKHPARWECEGSFDATISRMTRSTGAQIAKRILGIHDALIEIDEQCCRHQ